MKKRIKLLLSSLILLLVCNICVVGLTYSWFSGVGYIGYGGTYSKWLIIGGSKSQIENFAGIVSGKEQIEITYTEISAASSFSVDNLYPGAKQYFKTRVTNNYDTLMAYSIYISKIVCDSELNDYIKVGVTVPSSRAINFSNYEYSAEGDSKSSFSSLKLCDKYTLAAGNSFEIYWYIEILEGAGNDCVGKNLTIESVIIGN